LCDNEHQPLPHELEEKRHPDVHWNEKLVNVVRHVWVSNFLDWTEKTIPQSWFKCWCFSIKLQQFSDNCFILQSSDQTTWSIRILTDSNVSINHLVNKIYPFLPFSYGKKGHVSIIRFLSTFFFKGYDIKRDKQYTSVHCKKAANITDCNCSEKIGPVQKILVLVSVLMTFQFLFSISSQTEKVIVMHT
jgi:hypothetical protein